MENGGGLRERKKQATRHDLQSAALRLTAARGIDHVTVDDIAEAAGVSPRTFFNYFASKEQAVVGLSADAAAELRGAIAGRPAHEPPLEALRGVLRDLAGQIVDRADEIATRMQVIDDNPTLLPHHLANFAAFEQVLREAVAQRTGLSADGSLYPALVAAAAVAALRVSFAQWKQAGRRPDVAATLDEAFNRLAGGLPAPHPSPATA